MRILWTTLVALSLALGAGCDKKGGGTAKKVDKADKTEKKTDKAEKKAEAVDKKDEAAEKKTDKAAEKKDEAVEKKDEAVEKKDEAVVTPPAVDGANPLVALAPLAKLLDEGMNKVLQGEDPATAFPGLTVKADADRVKKLVEEAKAAGVAGAKVAILEYGLHLHKDNKRVFRLKAGLFMHGKQAFFELRGRKTEVPEGAPPEESGPRGLEAKQLAGALAPLAGIAAVLPGILKTPGCASLPLITVEDATPLMPPKAAAEVPKFVGKAQKKHQELCAEFGAVDFDPAQTRIDVDDLEFAAVDASGKTIGMIKAELDEDDGKILLELKRFKKFD